MSDTMSDVDSGEAVETAEQAPRLRGRVVVARLRDVALIPAIVWFVKVQGSLNRNWEG